MKGTVMLQLLMLFTVAEGKMMPRGCLFPFVILLPVHTVGKPVYAINRCPSLLLSCLVVPSV